VLDSRLYADCPYRLETSALVLWTRLVASSLSDFEAGAPSGMWASVLGAWDNMTQRTSAKADGLARVG